MDLAEVVRRHAPAYLSTYDARLPQAQRAALEAIVRCHTPACGGSLYLCESCGQRHFAWHRCSHRACQACGHRQAETWRQRQRARLLPVTYYLITFTVPGELRPFFRQHQQLLYEFLFQESAATLQDVAGRVLGGELGLLGVLHTWTRQLVYHPHLHYLAPAGALCPDGTLSFPKDAHSLLPVQRLSARFRTRLGARLRQQAPELYAQIPRPVWHRAWVVHAQDAGRGQAALSYLARYVQKTALSRSRLLAQDEQNVTFSYREAKTNQERTLTLSAHEFLRRFLQHVLPKGFRRIRTYGWLSPAARRRFATVCTLLQRLDQSDSAPASTLLSIPCPHCGQPMRRVGELPRAPPLGLF